jgi:hypothetical protein
LLLLLLSILALSLIIHSLGTRNGVTAAQVSETLPGDEIIPNTWITIDRAATLPVPSSQAWPWVQQLGKDRAGWYAPLWMENLLKAQAASSTLPQYQNLKVGEVVPDWGGGSLKVLALEQDHYVVYGSFHPGEATTTAQPYGFVWALVLENDTASSTSFHLRLRLAQPTGSTAHLIPPSLPGMIDYFTDIVLFDGLKERLLRR